MNKETTNTQTINIATVSLERPEQTSAEKNKGAGRRVVISANNAYGLPGDQLEVLDTERYMKNPVVLWNHDQWDDIPVARTTALNFNDNGDLVADFEFLPDDPFATRIQNAWDKGFINAASVGWKYRDYEETEPILLEWSFVSIPRDPDALRAGYEKLMNDYIGEKIKQATEKVSKGYAGVPSINPPVNVVEETAETASEEGMFEAETAEAETAEAETAEAETAEAETAEAETAEAETAEAETAEAETAEAETAEAETAEAETAEAETAEAETAEAETAEAETAEAETAEAETAEAETAEAETAEAETAEADIIDINEYRQMIVDHGKQIENSQNSINEIKELISNHQTLIEKHMKILEDKAANEKQVQVAREAEQNKIEVIRQAEKLLDENLAKDLAQKSVREILELAVGDSVEDVANKPDDYLRACVDQMVENRKEAPSYAPVIENTAAARTHAGDFNIMTLISNRKNNARTKEMN